MRFPAVRLVVSVAVHQVSQLPVVGRLTEPTFTPSTWIVRVAVVAAPLA